MLFQTRTLCCPESTQWAEIYGRLDKARLNANDPTIPRVPIPLPAGAWDESNVRALFRWKETLSWAKNHGFSHLITPCPNAPETTLG